MPELKMDKEGNFVVSDALPREQLEEIANMLGVQSDPKMNKADLTGMLLSAGAVPVAEAPPDWKLVVNVINSLSSSA